MIFYVGLHQPSDGKHFKTCFISVNRLLRRKTIKVENWIMDSGAFTEVMKHGTFRLSVEDYAEQIRKFSYFGTLQAAVSQDFICDKKVLERTGLTVERHQEMTIQRYKQLLKQDTNKVYIMPVLQGSTPEEYVSHVKMYGKLLKRGAWVGVGSVVSKSNNPKQVLEILSAIKDERPDLRLHGFGLKYNAICNREVLSLLYSSDSQAWSQSARRLGRNANSYLEAIAYEDKINDLQNTLNP